MWYLCHHPGQAKSEEEQEEQEEQEQEQEQEENWVDLTLPRIQRSGRSASRAEVYF